MVGEVSRGEWWPRMAPAVLRTHVVPALLIPPIRSHPATVTPAWGRAPSRPAVSFVGPGPAPPSNSVMGIVSSHGGPTHVNIA